MCVQTHGPKYLRLLPREAPRKRNTGGREGVREPGASSSNPYSAWMCTDMYEKSFWTESSQGRHHCKVAFPTYAYGKLSKLHVIAKIERRFGYRDVANLSVGTLQNKPSDKINEQLFGNLCNSSFLLDHPHHGPYSARWKAFFTTRINEFCGQMEQKSEIFFSITVIASPGPTTHHYSVIVGKYRVQSSELILIHWEERTKSFFVLQGNKRIVVFWKYIIWLDWTALPEPKGSGYSSTLANNGTWLTVGHLSFVHLLRSLIMGITCPPFALGFLPMESLKCQKRARWPRK